MTLPKYVKDIRSDEDRHCWKVVLMQAIRQDLPYRSKGGICDDCSHFTWQAVAGRVQNHIGAHRNPVQYDDGAVAEMFYDPVDPNRAILHLQPAECGIISAAPAVPSAINHKDVKSMVMILRGDLTQVFRTPAVSVYQQDANSTFVGSGEMVARQLDIVFAAYQPPVVAGSAHPSISPEARSHKKVILLWLTRVGQISRCGVSRKGFISEAVRYENVRTESRYRSCGRQSEFYFHARNFRS